MHDTNDVLAHLRQTLHTPESLDSWVNLCGAACRDIQPIIEYVLHHRAHTLLNPSNIYNQRLALIALHWPKHVPYTPKVNAKLVVRGLERLIPAVGWSSTSRWLIAVILHAFFAQTWPPHTARERLTRAFQKIHPKIFVQLPTKSTSITLQEHSTTPLSHTQRLEIECPSDTTPAALHIHRKTYLFDTPTQATALTLHSIALICSHTRQNPLL